jgi:hypothetical protein
VKCAFERCPDEGNLLGIGFTDGSEVREARLPICDIHTRWLQNNHLRGDLWRDFLKPPAEYLLPKVERR